MGSRAQKRPHFHVDACACTCIMKQDWNFRRHTFVPFQQMGDWRWTSLKWSEFLMSHLSLTCTNLDTKVVSVLLHNSLASGILASRGSDLLMQCPRSFQRQFCKVTISEPLLLPRNPVTSKPDTGILFISAGCIRFFTFTDC